MTKDYHIGKSEKEKQAYSDALGHITESSTVQDDLLSPTSEESHVPEKPDQKIIRVQQKKKKRLKKQNFVQRNIATIVISFIVGVISTVVPVLWSINGNMGRMSAQIQAQQEIIIRLRDEIDQIRTQYSSDTSNLQNTLRDYLVKIQEQAIRIQFLEQAQKNNP